MAGNISSGIHGQCSLRHLHVLEIRIPGQHAILGNAFNVSRSSRFSTTLRITHMLLACNVSRGTARRHKCEMPGPSIRSRTGAFRQTLYDSPNTTSCPTKARRPQPRRWESRSANEAQHPTQDHAYLEAAVLRYSTPNWI